MADVSDVVIGSTTLLVATTIIRKDIEKKENPKSASIGSTVGKPVIFGFLLAMALLSIAFVAPTIAKGLAYLSLVGAFVVNGPKVFDVLGGIH